MQVSVSRVVAFLTPVFAAASAALTPWLVKYTGLHIDATQVTALSITGATVGAGAALKWLHGNSLWEREYANIDHYYTKIRPVVNEVEGAVKVADPGIAQDIEGQADKVVEAAKAKLVAVITSVPTPQAAPAPLPAPAVPADLPPAA